MLSRNHLIRVSVVFLGAVLLLLPNVSYASWGFGLDLGGRRDRHEDRHFYHYHDHPHIGIQVGFLPDHYVSVWARGARYYYYDGLYYSNVGNEYVIVNPPLGAVVGVIPSDYQVVIIKGKRYFTDNGIYYIHTYRGYKVVLPPRIAEPSVLVSTPVPVIAAPVQVAAPAAPDAQGSITVNVPNAKGGYTAVVLRSSGSGYVGPQGGVLLRIPQGIPITDDVWQIKRIN